MIERGREDLCDLGVGDQHKGSDTMSRQKVRVELNLQGVNELMKSKEIQAVLQQEGEKVAAAAGEGYAARTHLANWIAVTNVYAETEEAKRENLEHNTLLKALGGTK